MFAFRHEHSDQEWGYLKSAIVFACQMNRLTSSSGVRDLRRFEGDGERVRERDLDGDLGIVASG